MYSKLAYRFTKSTRRVTLQGIPYENVNMLMLFSVPESPENYQNNKFNFIFLVTAHRIAAKFNADFEDLVSWHM